MFVLQACLDEKFKNQTVKHKLFLQINSKILHFLAYVEHMLNSNNKIIYIQVHSYLSMHGNMLEHIYKTRIEHAAHWITCHKKN